MKKFLSLLLSLILLFSVNMFVGCADRKSQLKLYVPGEYIDPDLLDAFEEWYYAETGEKVEVITPDTFDVVEEILIRVEKDKADYDILCPSDYTVERMIEKDLLLPIDKTRVDIEEVIRDEYVEITRENTDPELKYAVPYMYGTFGLMYDYSKTGKVIDSWDALFTDAYAGKSANKDSMREALTSAAIYRNREELARLSNNFTDYTDAYHDKLQSIYKDTSSDALKATTEQLIDMLHYARVWGGESLKFDMAGNATGIEVALMWSCDAGYVMNDYEDDNGEEFPGNRNMRYVVPKEGGNIYIDHFCIGKYAKNPKAANYFIEFMCDPENAIVSSEYAGAISPVIEAYDTLYAEYTDAQVAAEYIDWFDDRAEGESWYAMYIDMLFPSADTIARCGVMRDYGARDTEMSLGWLNVRYR